MTLHCVLVSGSLLGACYQQPPDYPDPGGWVFGTPYTPDPAETPPEADPPPGGPPPSEPYTLRLHNGCDRVVHLTFETLRSGCEAREQGYRDVPCERSTEIEPDATVTYSGTPPETVSIIDESGRRLRRLAQYHVRASRQEVEVDESCSKFRWDE